MDIATTITILKTLTPFVQAIPTVGTVLATVLDFAAQACQSAQDARIHRETYRQLAQEIATYAAAVSRAAQSLHVSAVRSGSEEDANSWQESWTGNVQQLASVFREVAETIEKRQAEDEKRRGRLLGGVRRLRYDISHKGDDKDQVERLRKKIDEAVRSFHIEGEIWGLGALESIQNEMRDTADRHAQELKAIAARQEAIAARQEAIAIRQREETMAITAGQAQHLEAVTARQTQELRVLISPQVEGTQQNQSYQQLTFIEQKLKPVLGARFGAESIPNGCLPGTREQLMAQLRMWANDNSENCPSIFGLTGLAGTGKTTVAVSFCEEFYERLPVITFFISRTSAERRIPMRIMHTIVYQLGTRQATARTVISDALASDQDITAQTLAKQVESLFLAPLKAWEGSQLPVLVVIDALDECNKINGREGGDLIPLIAAAIQQLPRRVKLLITSREEPEIWKMFKGLKLNTVENSVRLQNIEHTVVERDIKIYYAYHFLVISQKAGFEDETSWPDMASFERLVELTGRLFVFAALVIRLLSNPRINPKTRLEEILQAPTFTTGISVFKPLDDLYLDILIKAVDTGDEAVDVDTQERIRILIGALVLLQTPLNTRTIAALLNEDIRLIRSDIEHLSAVLVIPDSPEEPIATFHPSFSDYIQLRCKDQRFLIVPGDYHSHLLRCCLAIMDRHLKRDLCNIGDPSVMNNDIKDLEEKCNQFLPPELRYACEYWLNHLMNTNELGISLMKDFNWFCERHLLHWIEALSLLGKVSVAHVNLPGAISQCQRYNESEAISATSLLREIERVVKAYDSILKLYALQIYCSALMFMPECKLYEHTRQKIIGPVEVRSERLKNWPLLRQTLEGHERDVKSVVYSPDGTRIASGSYDKTIRVWDATTGVVLTELKGHTHVVESVAFSPDGARVLSGSANNTVKVWDATTGATLAELNGLGGFVRSITFSPSGTRIASALEDNTVQVWDVSSNAVLATLNGHTDTVHIVTFSPDETCIASGSQDRTICLWDTTTGATRAKLTYHTGPVSCIAFSRHGTRIASSGADRTIQVQDLITNATLFKLSVDSATWVLSVAFSPDGACIASSWDQTVRVWDIITGGVLVEFKVPFGDINSFAFSPDGLHIASGSSDNIVRVWDVIPGATLDRSEGYTDRVTSVALSPDGTRFAFGSEDSTVRIWDAITGTALARLNGHTGRVTSVVFSPNGTYIASSSRDSTVRVWDAITGAALVELNGHAYLVTSIAFSPDGSRIGSGSWDETVRVWDAITGAAIFKLDGHTSWVLSVAFSPDGTRVASGSLDHTVRVWDAITGATLAELNGYEFAVDSVAFSPDGTRIASNSLSTVWVWDAIAGVVLVKLEGSGLAVESVLFSEDGTQIIADDIRHHRDIWLAGKDFPVNDLHPNFTSHKIHTSFSTFYLAFNESSGWLELMEIPDRSAKRLCWLPPERRGTFWTFGGLGVFCTDEGNITILSCSRP